MAAKMNRKYIAESSQMQVNISGRVRANIQDQMPTAGRLIFQEAQDEVFKLMKSGQWSMVTMLLCCLVLDKLCAFQAYSQASSSPRSTRDSKCTLLALLPDQNYIYSQKMRHNKCRAKDKALLCA